MSYPISAEYVLGYFPELHDLVAARPASWTFRPTFGVNGDFQSVVLNRTATDYTDSIFVVDSTHVVATRMLHDEQTGGCVWSRQGANLKEITAELGALPEPGEPGAPTEVLKTDLLWSPE
jgi:hypothetical protein